MTQPLQSQIVVGTKTKEQPCIEQKLKSLRIKVAQWDSDLHPKTLHAITRENEIVKNQ